MLICIVLKILLLLANKMVENTVKLYAFIFCFMKFQISKFKNLPTDVFWAVCISKKKKMKIIDMEINLNREYVLNY